MCKNILEYLEISSQKHPDKVAFADECKSCTYAQLEEKSKILGSRLAQEIHTQMPIPILMEKGVNTVVAFMGTVYAGCFYTLLDPKQPTRRLAEILKTLGSGYMIVERKYQKEFEKLGFLGKVLYFEDCMGTPIDEKKLLAIRQKMLDIDPLYINFTSGSTGVPKGVVVSHRSVIDFLTYFTELFQITERDVIGNQAPFDFDVSVKDIYTTLKQGATMQMIPKKYFSFPMKLLDYLCEREVTTLIWAVSALCIITTLKGFDYRVPKSINKIIFSGEVMPIKHLNIWRTYLPDALYANVYGPTEITCNCTYYIIDRTFEEMETLPIGRPFPNEKILLFHENQNMITENEADVVGEIYVSGTALSLGYYNNEEQTQKVFIQNPVNKSYMELLYRTGDLGYYNREGQLCFAGRRDFQIKHMGHRIELGEIEIALGLVEKVNRGCCVYAEAEGKIVAFYEGEATKKEIVKAMGVKLPSYMIPNVFCQVESVPITNNGKIDRKKLLSQYMEV